MAIPGQANINIGAENQVAGSDTLFQAFHTIQDNFDTLFDTASPFDTFRAGEGVEVSSNVSNGVVNITNTGVTKITAGTGVTISGATGNVTISAAPQGPAGVTRVGLTSSSLNVTGGNIVSQGNFTVDLPRITTGENFATGQYIAPTLTVDGFGRITQIANGVGVGTVTSVGLTPGKGIKVTGGPIIDSGAITVENTGVTSVQAGSGIQVTSANGDITISATSTGIGTVSYVGIRSNTLSVTGGPITDVGNINVDLPSNMSLTNIIASGNANVGGNLNLTGNARITGNVNAYSVTSTYGAVQSGFEIGNDGYILFRALNGTGNYVAFVPPTSVSVAGLSWQLPNTIGNASQVLVSDGGPLFWRSPPAAGSNTQIQFNDAGNANGNTNLTFNKTTGTMTAGNISVTGNITTVNVAASTQMTAPRFISNVANGTAPFTVTSTTQVANLNAALAGTVVTSAQPNITSTGTLTGLTVSGNINTGGIVKTGSFTTSNLPTASTAGAGARAFVTDSIFQTWGQTYTGGGSNAVPVWSDGTNWKIG